MKKYWTSIEEIEPERFPEPKRNELKNGFSDILESVGNGSRRDFLKFFGFSVASAAVLSSCERPVTKAIPLLNQPEDVKPGIANYYASAFYDGNEACGIVVKVRDGRPIKIEGNELSEITTGGTSARVQASLLNLYDESRPKGAIKKGASINWEDAFEDISNQLESIGSAKEITLVTPTVISPSLLSVISSLKSKYAGLNHIQYDAISYSGLRNAWKQMVGESIIPSYRFDKAQTIVGFNADFIGTWLEPVRFTKQYIKRRKLDDGEKSMSRHYQFETTMTLTGSNADHRYMIKPSEEGKYIVSLYNVLLKKLEYRSIGDFEMPEMISKIADELIQSKGNALVVSGSNDENIQLVVCGINQIIGALGSTIDVNEPVEIYKGDDGKMSDWVVNASNGNVGAVIFYQSNPIYNYPEKSALESAIKRVGLRVSINNQQDETSVLCDYILGSHHSLESWNDYEPVQGHYLLNQPTIRPIFSTKQGEEILMKLSGDDRPFYDLIREVWKKNILKGQNSFASFDKFWDQSLHDGYFKSNLDTKKLSIQIDDSILRKAAQSFLTGPEEAKGFELYLYQTVALGDGHLANNPWLQELPDPISKVCWDNYLCVSPTDANLKGWNAGDMVKIGDDELPVLIQPGQTRNTISIALGYGRANSGTVASGLGVNGFKYAHILNGTRQYNNRGIDCVLTGSSYELATTQTHHSMENRPIIRETSLEEYLVNPASGNEMHAEAEKNRVSLYKNQVYNGHHWAMVIDLNSCIGCNACVVACSVENNVPVVGREEVRRGHDMHWIRIDRYYSGDLENPEVVRQPVMCQHCDEAPCENVCPVAATNHSSEGINQMAYNRCIGTRYCNNNCPYKVRRFNWFDYTGADAIPFNTVDPAGMTMDVKRMVLNPDVTVRAKGVIEKCSFCIQRIQEKKLEAKADGRMLEDGEIKTACQQSCPADAIVFGDLNDPKSRVVQLMKEARRYHLLEELKTLPSVAYLTKVRNTDKSLS